MLIFTLIDVTLMIRPEKGKISPLARIPVATKCVYMGCWPIVFALLILSYKVSCHAPLAVLQVAPWLIGLPISVIFVGELKDYFFFMMKKVGAFHFARTFPTAEKFLRLTIIFII
jgi:hypothetical protein